MSFLSAIYRELVYGGHLLALGTASIAASAALLIGEVPGWDLLLMAYLFSFGAYSINRVSDFAQDVVSHPDRTAYLAPRVRALKWASAGCFLVGYLLALARNLIFFSALLLPLLLALAYSVSSKAMAGSLGISRLKEGVLVKNLTVSAGWSLIPVLVGLYYSSLPVAIFALTPFIFLRLMVNTIFFDQRDIAADAAFGVTTLPVKYGAKLSTKAMNLIDVGSGVYLAAAVLLGAVPNFAWVLLAFVPYSFAYRLYSKSGKHRDSLRDFAADGEYVLWGVLTYIGHL
jgi:4-hydroxybenzoate polyprenyltransferase